MVALAVMIEGSYRLTDRQIRLQKSKPTHPLLKQQLKDKLIEHKQYIDKHGQDMPEIRNWKWQG